MSNKYESTRRTALKTVAAGFTLGIPTSVSATSSQAPSEVVKIRHAVGNGMSNRAVENQRKHIIEDFKDKGGTTKANPNFGHSNVETTEYSLVAYAARIDANGVLHEYGIEVPDQASFKALESRFEKVVSQYEEEEYSITSNNVSTSSIDPDWEWYLDGTRDKGIDPYGVVTNNIDGYYAVVNSSENAYALQQFTGLEAGAQRYNSSYFNIEMENQHDWDPDVPSYLNKADADLKEFDPSGSGSNPGNLSISIGISGLSFGYTTNLSDSSYNNTSSPSREFARWNVSFDTSASMAGFEGWQPGSSAMADRNDGVHERLFDARTKGTFSNANTTETIEHAWKMNTELYS